jgi:type IV secretory pathway TraG/TraD family ATPase VirD4
VKNRWGREETYRWPSGRPVWTITALLLTVVATLAAAGYEYSRWPYFQQAYLGMYIGSEVRLWSKTAPSLMAYRVEGKQKRLAVDRDLSDAAVLSRKAKIEWERGTYNNAELHRWLEREIYGGESPWALLWAAVWKVGAGVLLVGLALAVPRDQERRRTRKYGRRTKGPELVTAAEFNRSQKSDGIGFITKERRTLIEFLLRCDGKRVRVPRERESSHFLLMGDTGSGKSSLIRQILMQVEGRGETAIVYDPALEYTPQFFNPTRGDVILNPLDERMPYWSPCDEVRHEAEAEGLAAALFKDDPRTNPFFVMVPRQIFAHLLIEQPKRTPQELLAILRDERELAKRLKDTEHAAAIYPDAGPQRGGMIATLNSVSNALKLLPRKEETKTSWTATEWAQQRQGWLFVTSPPEFRERLRPLISMWLDMLVLRLMNQGKPGVRPVWLILDELQSLHALPQLHTAITESRKVKNPVVLGFQGRSQRCSRSPRRKSFYERMRRTPRNGSARPSEIRRSSG